MADCLSPSEILNAGTSCSPDLRLHRRRKEHAIGSGQADFPSTNGCRPCSGWTRQDLSRLPGRWSALSVVSCRSGCRLAGCPAWNSMCAGCRFWRCEKPTKNLPSRYRGEIVGSAALARRTRAGTMASSRGTECREGRHLSAPVRRHPRNVRLLRDDVGTAD